MNLRMKLVSYSEGCPESSNISGASNNIKIGVCYPSACSPYEFATVLSKMSISSTISLTANPDPSS